MDSFNREIIVFVLAWAPYGGPPEEDVLPLFGMTTDRLKTVFCQVVQAELHGDLTPEDRQLIDRATEFGHWGMHTCEAIERTQGAPSRRYPVSPPATAERQVQPAEPQWVLCQGVWRWR